MSLAHEATIKVPGYLTGDTKLVGYSIAFTAQQLVEPESGWFLLNGAALSQTTYATLFAHYGTSFNTANGLPDPGVGNFRLPDLTDGFLPIPKDLTNFTSFAAVGNPSNGLGEINHTLTQAELPAHVHPDSFSISSGSHNHTISGSAASADGSHTHLYTYATTSGDGGSSGLLGGTTYTNLTGTTSNASTHPHSASPSIGSNSSGNANLSGSINATGSGGSHNNLQPYLVVGGWLVKYR